MDCQNSKIKRFLGSLLVSIFLTIGTLAALWNIIIWVAPKDSQASDFTDIGMKPKTRKKQEQKIRLMQRQRETPPTRSSSSFRTKAISDIVLPLEEREVDAAAITPNVIANNNMDGVEAGVGLDFSVFDLGEFSSRLKKAGAKEGHITVSLIWENLNDLDLHCIDPNGEEIYFGNRIGKLGNLDVDMNAGGKSSKEPVENLFYEKPVKGEYQIFVNHYNNRGDPDPTEFMVWVRVQGKREKRIKGKLTDGDPKKPIHTIYLSKDIR